MTPEHPALAPVRGGPPPAEERRALLIGGRASVLRRLAAALRQNGIGAEITTEVRDVPAEELRPYGAVAFDPAVTEGDRAAVREAFARAGVDAVFVDGPTPVVPVLAARMEQALDRTPAHRRPLTSLAADGHAVTVEVGAACHVELTVHRLDRLHRTRTRVLLDAPLEAGRHSAALDGKEARGRSFAVARGGGNVLVTAVR
ncbi:hypothetical protein [Streptomyces macrosporus]|uniref:Uncharacterized protein n=1 Tax=Streptomyces macrosporus TaxID=44032 RepID=A0ABN3JAL9_9ACTN